MRWTAALVPLLLFAALDDRWPQFRGTWSTGTAEDPRLPDHWSTTDNVAWKTDIPGLGWSSPIVWGDRIFVTTAVSSDPGESPKAGIYDGGRQAPPATGIHRWLLVSIDWKSGKILWQQEVHKGKAPGSRHTKNSFASETPVTDGERVYVYLGNIGVFCYNFQGQLRWSKKLDAHQIRFGYGTAASPVLHEKNLYIVADNEDQSYLLALDKRTGRQLWKVDRDEKSNWATPYVWQTPKRTEIVTPGANKTRAYSLTGELLWELGGMSRIMIPTPFSRFGLLYIASGYGGGDVHPVYAIKPGAFGDISLKEGESSNAFIAWHLPRAGPYNPSALVYGEHFYTLLDRGFFACYEARTGKTVYDKTRIDPEAGAFTASPWAYNGKIFALSEDGDTYVIQAGVEFKLLGKNSLGEMCLATPAISRGSLILRTASKLYRIGGDAGAEQTTSATDIKVLQADQKKAGPGRN